MKKTIKRGEIYFCDLGEDKGSVQGGYRPVIVMQANRLTVELSTVLVAPITSVIKRTDLFSHLIITERCGLEKNSMILFEQIRPVNIYELKDYIGKIRMFECWRLITTALKKPSAYGIIQRLRVEIFAVCVQNIWRNINSSSRKRITLFFGIIYFLARRSEVLGLKWANIDLVNGTIWIKETLQQSTKEMTGGSNYTSDTKTESSNRTLPIIPSVREELLKQRAFQDRNRNLLDSVYYLSDYVCTFADGKEITPNYLTKKFHQIISKHKELPQIRFHDLRHSVASNLLNDGFSTVQVAEWLGHSSSTTTLKFYAHIDKTSKMAIAEKLAAS